MGAPAAVRSLGLGCAAWLLAALAGASPAQETPAPADSPGPSPSPSPARPISDSVDPVVKKLLEANEKDPCVEAEEQGLPCFPVSTTISGRTISVRESLFELGGSDKPSPSRPPTRDELEEMRPGRLNRTLIPNVGEVKMDPGCVAKAIVKGLKGKNDTYYIYRLRDVHGERVALYDRRLDATTFQGELQFVGRFEGECEALQAYRAEERRLRATQSAPGDLARP